jgi:hypothetical protein
LKLSVGLEPKDLDQIDQIYWQHHAEEFFIPSAENCVTLATVKEGGRIVAFGMAKLFPEAILVLDKSVDRRHKVVAFRMLMQHGINAVRNAGHRYLHATIHDMEYGRLLAKHYGFTDAKGKQISLEL